MRRYRQNYNGVEDSVTPSAFNQALSLTPPAQGVIPVNVTTLWAWDNTQSKWYFYAPILEANGGLAGHIASKGYLDFATLPAQNLIDDYMIGLRGKLPMSMSRKEQD